MTARAKIRPSVLLVTLFFGAGLAPAVLAQDRGAGAPLLTGARVLDPEGESYLGGHAVLIEDGRIAQVLAPDDNPPAVVSQYTLCLEYLT